MGIPNLLSTLESFAEHAHLDRRRVVIDGPALAYHVLYKCSANRLSEPPYSLLAKAVRLWLDRLVEHGVIIEAIYFDGFLPLSKRPVRFERVQRSTAQLGILASKNTHGLAIRSTALDEITPQALFQPSSNQRSQQNSLPTPAFLVPLIIEALRGSGSDYSHLVQLVPGEADDFCAKHVFKEGRGCILTSDSDLLVFDDPGNCVVFFRDIYSADDHRLACAIFTPEIIAAQFQVPCMRIGYEQQRQPRVSLNHLRRACLEECSDPEDFESFCQTYIESDRAVGNADWDFSLLDPRLSELIHQLAQPHRDALMFLPTLLEDPSRRSSWESSLYIRTMSYTFVTQALRSQHSTIREYRRIQSLSKHKGTLIKMSKRTARLTLNEVAAILNKCTKLSTRGDEPIWLLLCLALDVHGHMKMEKPSLLLGLLRNPSASSSSKRSKAFSWELLQCAAQMLAMLYSLRLFVQAILSMPSEAYKEIPDGSAALGQRLHGIIPPVTGFPDTQGLLSQLCDARRAARLRSALEQILDLGDEDEESADDEDVQKLAKTQNSREAQTSAKPRVSNNPFDMLADDS